MNEIERHIRKVNEWQDWTPTFTCTGSMTFTADTLHVARYSRLGNIVFFYLYVDGTTGGSASTNINFTLPINARYVANELPLWAAQVSDAGTDVGRSSISSATLGTVQNRTGTNWGIGAARQFLTTGFYETDVR